MAERIRPHAQVEEVPPCGCGAVPAHQPWQPWARATGQRRPEQGGATIYHQSFFGRFAQGAARAMGHPFAFVLAVLIIVGWALTGPFFGYSDTW